MKKDGAVVESGGGGVSDPLPAFPGGIVRQSILGAGPVGFRASQPDFFQERIPASEGGFGRRMVAAFQILGLGLRWCRRLLENVHLKKTPSLGDEGDEGLLSAPDDEAIQIAGGSAGQGNKR